jgi:hypothetical protein
VDRNPGVKEVTVHDHVNAGCVPFIEADNPEELTERIRQQDRLSPGDRDSAP